MTADPIFVFGSGGHAKVVVDILERAGRYSIRGIVTLSKDHGEFCGYPVTPADWRQLGIKRGIVAVGDNWKRSKIAEGILSQVSDFEFVTAVHPSAQVAPGVHFGPGTVVAAGVCVNPDAEVGKHVILNTCCSVDHDDRIEDFASIAPGAILGGTVHVSPFAAVGLGASCIHQISIGAHAVVGAGAVVLRNMPELVVAYGNPCRVMKKRKIGDPYL